MGSVIVGYRVKIQGADGIGYSYSQDSCSPQDADMVATTSCLVPIYIVMDYPFSLAWGSSIYASV